MEHPMTFRTSDAGRAFIKGYEKCELACYVNVINGNPDVPTIGWGHTGPDVYRGLIWTQEQADEAFERDLIEKGFEPTVNRLCEDVPTTQGQFDAMVSLAYNVGPGWLKKSQVMQFHRAGKYDEAADAFEHFDMYHGEHNDALHGRRVAEGQMYLDASPV